MLVTIERYNQDQFLMATDFFIVVLPLHDFLAQTVDVVHIVKAIEIAKKDQLIHGPVFHLKEIIGHLIQNFLLHTKLAVSLANQALHQNPIQLIVKRRATSLGLFQLLRLQVLKSLDVI